MSGETEKQVSGWTTDTLRDHVLALIERTKITLEAADNASELRNEQRFTAQQQAIKDALISQKEAVAAALVAAEKAVLVAEQNAEKWRAAANEWRGAMNDRERSLMPRMEAEQRIHSNAEKIDVCYKTNADKIEMLRNRMEVGDAANAESIKVLAQAVDKTAGRKEGLMIVFAVIAAIATVISIFLAVRGA